MESHHPSTPGGRASRTLSFRSDKSAGSKGRNELVESPKDKEARDRIWKNNSKANPNAAMTEAQPGDIALLAEATIAPLRGLQHRDAYGNPIVDPDLSNPTRPRLERPLDTIRSFEKAIDNGYKRRSSYNRSDTIHGETQQHASRRNSYFGMDHHNAGSARPMPSGSGSYGPQSNSARRHPPNRMQSDSHASYSHRPYGHHSYQQSQNTMITDLTNGSDSTGPWASHTEPSSENSSIDKTSAVPRTLPQDGHVQAGHPPNVPTHQAYPYGNNNLRGPIAEEQGYGAYDAGPAPPSQNHHVARRPIPLGSSGGVMGPPARSNLPYTPRPEPVKKEGWLRRRFSKRS